jgi:outer membrane protein insertion porin family
VERPSQAVAHGQGGPSCHTTRAVVLRLAIFLITVCTVAHSVPGQFGGSTPFAPGGPADFKNDPKPRRAPQFSIQDSKPIVNVLISGRRQVDEARIRSMINTRSGRDYDPVEVQRDVRTLIGSGLFGNVRTFVKDAEGGVEVTFDLVERPLIQYIRFTGNVKKSEKKLLKQLGLRVGDPLTRFHVEEARRRVEEFYVKAGFTDVQIAVVEGLGLNDQGVVLQINEGTRQRILSTKFEGNTIASDSRLKTQVLSKPGFFWLFGGNVIQDQVEQDYARLTAYYRSLGFLNAKVSSRMEWNQEHTWVSIIFMIDEGPRFRIRNVCLRGNQILDSSRLMSTTQTRAGEYFNLARLQRDLSSIRDEYGGNGYIFADVDAEPQILEEAGWLDLVYKINEGEQYRVGRIIVNIDGEERHTRHSVVLNRLSIKPGQIIDLREIRSSERRLMASQLFNADPTQGPMPTIAVKPPEGDEVIARQPETGSSTFRGQSPQELPVGSQPHIVQKPVVDLEVRVATNRPREKGCSAGRTSPPEGDGQGRPSLTDHSVGGPGAEVIEVHP